MKIARLALITYAQDCAVHAAKLDRIALQRLLRLLKKDRREFIESWCLFKAVASSGLAKAATEVNLLFRGRCNLRQVFTLILVSGKN